MRRLDRRVTAVKRVMAPGPSRSFLDFARAVVAFGGTPIDTPGAEASVVALARWLESGRRHDPCGLG